MLARFKKNFEMPVLYPSCDLKLSFHERPTSQILPETVLQKFES